MKNDIFNKLKNTFYNKESKILQFYHKNIRRNSIISFQPQITDFVTIMDDDNRIYSVKYNGLEKEDFLKEVYDGLHKIFDKNNIIPKEKLEYYKLFKVQISRKYKYTSFIKNIDYLIYM